MDKEYDTCIDMHYSVYRIHTDQGTYVGHTSDFNYRMGWHYNCKFSDESINLDMRENFDVWYVTRKMKELHM